MYWIPKPLQYIPCNKESLKISYVAILFLNGTSTRSSFVFFTSYMYFNLQELSFGVSHTPVLPVIRIFLKHLCYLGGHFVFNRYCHQGALLSLLTIYICILPFKGFHLVYHTPLYVLKQGFSQNSLSYGSGHLFSCRTATRGQMQLSESYFCEPHTLTYYYGTFQKILIMCRIVMLIQVYQIS